jgi:hypothetical protein
MKIRTVLPAGFIAVSFEKRCVWHARLPAHALGCRKSVTLMAGHCIIVTPRHRACMEGGGGNAAGLVFCGTITAAPVLLTG